MNHYWGPNKVYNVCLPKASFEQAKRFFEKKIGGNKVLLSIYKVPRSDSSQHKSLWKPSVQNSSRPSASHIGSFS